MRRSFQKLKSTLLVVLWAFSVPCLLGAEAPYVVALQPDNSFSHVVASQGKAVLSFQITGWGPGWSWGGQPLSIGKADEGVPLKIGGEFTTGAGTINLSLEAQASSDREVTYAYTVEAEKNVPLTMLAIVVTPLEGGQASDKSVPARVTLTDGGKESDSPYPFGRGIDGKSVSKAVFHLASGDVTMTFEPGVAVTADGALRIKLVSGECKAGKAPPIKMKLSFSKPCFFAATEAAGTQFVKELGEGWFPFVPGDFSSPSVIGMEDWLEKPAGKRGGVRMVGDKFQFEDGTPVKFWGTNLQYTGACTPTKELADVMVARFAKMGINAVRLHKFSNRLGWEGIGNPNDSTQFDPDGLARMDYFTSLMASKGIYYGISHSFHFKIRPGDKAKLLAYDEIANNLKADTYGLINYAEDVQDLMIQMMVNFMNHTNPHTGKKNSEDPAMAWFELHNEDDIFFFTVTGTFDSCPTYAKKLTGQYNDWLKAKYGTQDRLAAAWGDALPAGETLEAKNVFLRINPWFMGSDNLSKKAAKGVQTREGVVPSNQDGAVRRLMDAAAFLHETQNKFYTKFAKAIRGTGYKGPICGSPWQAVSGVPHYYNLKSDYLAGFIDRHNYGATQLNATLLSPGLGMFSTGLQQVLDRPFALSEWTNVFPSHYLAEGPAMMAVYGMGLQGWDASYEFMSEPSAIYAPTVGNPPWNGFKVDLPVQMGQFPALARMIYRGDIKEGDVISSRKVSKMDLEKGELPFSDKVQQSGDVKTFTGAVPPEAMLAGRCVVEFTDKSEPPVIPDLAKYRKGAITTSNTGQLAWDATTPEQCSFTVNTAGTKALVGFAENKKAELGNVTLTSHAPYISLFVTALQKGETLENAKSALVTIVSRNTTRGLKFSTIDQRVLSVGDPKGPVLMEPVKADVAIKGRNIVQVNVLNADGVRTEQRVPVTEGAFQLDTGRDKTMYYEIVFQ